MFRIRMVDFNLDKETILRRQSFAKAMAVVRIRVATELGINPNREALICPNCSYVWDPEAGHYEGKPYLTITVVDEADDPKEETHG